jgi:hypothetical protein
VVLGLRRHARRAEKPLGEKDHILPGTKEFFDKAVKQDDFVVITTARDEGYRERIIRFMRANKLKCDMVLCGLPSGPRILINDKKPDGTKTAYSLNLRRDRGIDANIHFTTQEQP